MFSSTAFTSVFVPAYPVKALFLPITRWHGIKIGSRFRLLACPMARTAFGFPIASAISP